MAIHATSAVLAIAAVIAIALCFVFIVTLAIRKSNKKGKPGMVLLFKGGKREGGEERGGGREKEI